MYSTLEKKAKENLLWQQEIRHWFHQHPELAYTEYKTSEKIQAELSALGIPFTTGWGKRDSVGGTGVVAHIGSMEGPCVLLRADIDALPINEQADVPYISQNKGVMHACGHDSHIAMLLGAAKLLKEEKLPKGTVRLIFQPAEEKGAGAEAMINEGVLALAPKPSFAFGLHSFGGLPTGTFATRPGVAMAAAELFEINVKGKGGHAGIPAEASDPIPTAMAIVQAAQTIASRSTSPVDMNHAGVVSTHDAFNVIPDSVRIRGTLRSLTSQKMDDLKARLTLVTEQTGKAFNQSATITFVGSPYHPTVNDAKLVALAKQVIDRPLIDNAPPTMGGEDFSYFTREIPSLFMFLGTGSGVNPPTNVCIHNPFFVIDDEALPIGSAALATLAIKGLEQLSHQS